MIPFGDKPLGTLNMDELAARCDAGDDDAKVEAAERFWGAGALMAQVLARAKFNNEPVPEVNEPDPDYPSGADADRAAGWHLPNDAGV